MTRAERLFYRKLRNRKTSTSSHRTRCRREQLAERSARRRAWNTFRREQLAAGLTPPAEPSFWWWLH